MQVTQKQVADWYGVSSRTVRDWDKAGCPSIAQGKTKIYDSVEVDKWCKAKAIEIASAGIVSMVDDEKVKEATRIKAVAQAESAQYDAEMKRIELAKRRRDVIPRLLAEDRFSDFTGIVRQCLERLPGRWEARIGVCTTSLERKRKLQLAVEEVLAQIAKEAKKEEQQNDEPDTDDNETAED